MRLVKLYIIRHADPDYSIDDLTEAGHLEAAALGKKMKDIGLDELYASSMGRAKTTASYIAKETGLTIQEEDWARELAHWNAELPSGEAIAAWNYPGELMEDVQKDLTEWKRSEDFWLKNPDKNELYDQLIADSDAFLAGQGLKRQGGMYKMTDPQAERKQIALVCHAGFGVAWLAHLLHLPLSSVWKGFWLPTSSVTTVLFEKRETDILVPRCIGLSDVSHLDQAGLPVTSQGLPATNYE